MMVAGAFYLPKENKKKPLGEDAHFICSEGHTIGVADGVGSWSSFGVDAGNYSRMLMSKAEASARSQAGGGGGVNPMKAFNYPFQLGRYKEADRPVVAARIKVDVRPGDVIVMATDGLFDNVKDDAVAELVGGGGGSPGKAAERLAKEALKIARSKDVETPFAVEARKAGRKISGGKYDDITVIVAYIKAAAD
ncbi:unnamed protein product [Cuscuta campestris]|uniref:Protein phosphatase n=1 Tax=Cuscuta campestris TaxID=132261 RepID=A0A484M6T2_9ASTE|nr:unnamed protein product [Cuscuta campestris]